MRPSGRGEGGEGKEGLRRGWGIACLTREKELHPRSQWIFRVRSGRYVRITRMTGILIAATCQALP